MHQLKNGNWIDLRDVCRVGYFDPAEWGPMIDYGFTRVEKRPRVTVSLRHATDECIAFDTMNEVIRYRDELAAAVCDHAPLPADTGEPAAPAALVQVIQGDADGNRWHAFEDVCEADRFARTADRESVLIRIGGGWIWHAAGVTERPLSK